MRAKFINESWDEERWRLIEDIFAIWDNWEDDREGIESFYTGNRIEFWFKNGWSDDFYVDVEEYLKNYKIKYFGEKEPIEWDWKDQSLKINQI